jgi:hypothetical protein
MLDFPLPTKVFLATLLLQGGKFRPKFNRPSRPAGRREREKNGVTQRWGHELHHPTSSVHHHPHGHRPPPVATELYRIAPRNDQTTPRNRSHLRARATPGGTAHEAPPGLPPSRSRTARHRFPPTPVWRPRPAPDTSGYLRAPATPHLLLRSSTLLLSRHHHLASVCRLLMQWRRQGNRGEGKSSPGAAQRCGRGSRHEVRVRSFRVSPPSSRGAR